MLARLWQRARPRRHRARRSTRSATPTSAARIAATLIAYFERHAALLDDDAKRRLHTNPLRILDSKNPAMQDDRSPARRSSIDRLGDASRAHFDGAAALLDDAGIAFAIDPRLVRGLDYYNRTVFEWVTDRARRAGHRRRRRPLRRPVRAAGRQADAGVRLRDRHRAHGAAAAGRRRRRATRAPLAYVVHAGDAGGSARAPRRRDAARRRHAPSSSTPAAAASSRR